MSRAVLTILVALPMLLPQGLCLRKFDCLGWLHRTAATTTTTSHVRIQRADERHPSSCQCCCKQRDATGQESADGVSNRVDERVHDGTPPQPEGPCCPAICKARLDKIVQVENPQPCGEVAFVGFAPAPTRDSYTSPPHRLRVVTHAPPLYISFCTLLI